MTLITLVTERSTFGREFLKTFAKLCWLTSGVGGAPSSTTIVNFRGTIEGGDLILPGFCSKCGTEVVRLVEGG